MKTTFKFVLIVVSIFICIGQKIDDGTKKLVIKNEQSSISTLRPPSANKLLSSRPISKKSSAVDEFSQFVKKFNKTYATKEEEAAARKAFIANSKNDKKHNQVKKVSYKRGSNAYSDKDFPWKVKNRMGAKKSRSSSSSTSSLSEKLASPSLSTRMGEVDTNLPENVNWTDWNSPVRDQGDCGTCWIFAPLAVLEYLLIVIRENLTVLSAQEVLDCNVQETGCDGGWPTDSFNYLIKKGLTSENSYPYLSYQSDCLDKRFKKTLFINESFEEFLKGDEEELKSIVYNYGPTVVVMYASEGFTQYAGGVFFEKKCPNHPNSYNHAVVVVGYGTDPEAGDFWIIKNSWGTDWGEFGYGRVARNKNMCGIANYAMNPSSSWISMINFNQTAIKGRK